MTDGAGSRSSPASTSTSRSTSRTTSRRRPPGVKGENSVKLFGNDLETLEKTADKIKAVHGRRCRASPIWRCFNSLGQPTVRIDVDRDARRALRPGARRHQRHGAGGDRRPGGRRSVRGRQRPALSDDGAPGAAVSQQPRGDPPHHRSARRPPAAAASIQVPLADVADVTAGLRRLLHLSRAAGALHSRSSSACAAAIWAARCSRPSAQVAEQVPMPGGYRLEWVGEFGNLQDALQRLAIAVPISLALICLLLYVNFGSLRRHRCWPPASCRWR